MQPGVRLEGLDKLGASSTKHELMAGWSPSASDGELRGFYQARLAIFSKALVGIFVLLLTLINVLYAVAPETRPARAPYVNAVCVPVLLMCMIFWWRTRRGPIAIGRLFWMDFAEVTMVGAVLGASAYLSADQTANIYSTLFYFTFALFTRTAIVPSSARRTFWLSTIAFSPMVAGATAIGLWAPDKIGIPAPYFVAGSVVYGAVAIVLATLCSSVMYGLRRQLEEVASLGQYTLLEKIGQGGMGTVYRAKHAMLRRPTAIKLLSLDRVSETEIRRFEREVQITSELTHPNTVVIYDYGRSPDGVFYYAMEYIDGIDLDRLVSEYGAQPVGRAIHILRQICGALDEAHGKGLVHRDIKPGNVLLCSRAEQSDCAKVVDFGLVKDLSTGQASTGRVAGTPAYLAPEIITGTAELGPRSDLYSLGCLAYYLVSGQQVFDAGNSIEMCVHHASSVPTALSDRSQQTVPHELNELIMRCLAKRPEDRPRSTRELIDVLEALSQQYPWTEADARRWWQGYTAKPAGEQLGKATTLRASVLQTKDLGPPMPPTEAAEGTAVEAS